MHDGIYHGIKYGVYGCVERWPMVKKAPTKIMQVGSRHTIYLQKDLVGDSAFPFKPKEPLTVRIEGSRLIVERAKK